MSFELFDNEILLVIIDKNGTFKRSNGYLRSLYSTKGTDAIILAFIKGFLRYELQGIAFAFPDDNRVIASRDQYLVSWDVYEGVNPIAVLLISI